MLLCAMSDPLIRIKRLLLSGRYVFSFKAELELLGDDLMASDVVEAIVNAPAISKTLRSRSAARSDARERLYVIMGTTYDGVLIYTKGTIRRVQGDNTYYLLVSSKRWTPEGRDA